LRELGYVEGESLTIERRFAEGQAERLPGLAAELVALPVDVLVAIGVAIGPARAATGTIPIVMVNAVNPVEQGLAASLAHPGGNLTGLSILPLPWKLIELLKATAPAMSHAHVLGVRRIDEQTRASAATLGVTVDAVPVDAPDDLDRAFETAVHPPDDGLIAFGGALTLSLRARIAELAVAAGIPLIGDRDLFAQAGGLMSYGSNDGAALRRAAIYVDKILKGAHPADLPIEQPTVFDLVINLKTARALGLTFPQSVLQLTTQTIE
jgi:putative ABC transport system substrate-binding protein